MRWPPSATQNLAMASSSCASRPDARRQMADHDVTRIASVSM
jgi:hypothetical protein